MGKQRSIQILREGGDLEAEEVFRSTGTIPAVFEDHYRLALKTMTPEHAAANAHDAVQRHLASVRESEEGDGM